MSVVIKAENISKLYRLGHVGTGSFAQDLNRWWAKVRGKEDPYLKVGGVNDRTVKDNSEYVWALKDINFEVEKGEALGIIGRNGAGKSTLLKILSRTTTPTTGVLKARGRIASLLEVGTGFHPELSGRENIYLNGAILGMSKMEITRKFDEIVAFAGVEKYVDTPVKRYSSGMYVRLAFGVAAHLESEILIVDEVLAVGDAEFQKKCLGKMGDLSNKEGRTVLFVSHNMQAVKSLCTKGIYMKNGGINAVGNINEVASLYEMASAPVSRSIYNDSDMRYGNSQVRIHEVSLVDHSSAQFLITEEVKLKVRFTNYSLTEAVNVNFYFCTADGVVVFTAKSPVQKIQKGLLEAICIVPRSFLNDMMYSVNVMVVSGGVTVLYIENSLYVEGIEPARESGWMGKIPGLVRPTFNWNIEEAK